MCFRVHFHVYPFATKDETARTLILDLLEICRAKGIRDDCQGIQGTDRGTFMTQLIDIRSEIA